ncbi:transport and Golgi organization protein 1 homolog isoform X2 [Rana temporaria]|uniref:transport and Golgi organization protein 1 homolog isoform X2 n=1 Tax=Rana temporaria TaxID=8407 RepID=UPI001AAC7FD6|nr:transport and Golgi organization protein 1 homolog isoform X2 [Rana temporaria]
MNKENTHYFWELTWRVTHSSSFHVTALVLESSSQKTRPLLIPVSEKSLVDVPALPSQEQIAPFGSLEKESENDQRKDENKIIEDTLSATNDVHTTAVNGKSKDSQQENVAHQANKENAKSRSQVPAGEQPTNVRISLGAKEFKESKNIESFTLIDKEQIVKLKTEAGSTGDAVVTEDEQTRRVTFDGEYQYKHFEHYEPQEDDGVGGPTETPLLSYEKHKIQASDATAFENDSTTFSDAKTAPYKEEGEVPVDMGHATPIKQETSILTTLGDTFFAIISGGECTQDVTYPGRTNLEEQENYDEPSEELEDTHLYLLGIEKSNMPKNELLKNVDDDVVLDYKGSSDNEHAKSDSQVPDSEQSNGIYQKGANNSKESKHTKSFTLIDKDKIVNLKTEAGSTGDAVVTEDEETRLVTFNGEYQYKHFEHYEPQEDDGVGGPAETPLLSYEKFKMQASDATAFENDSTTFSDTKVALFKEEVKVSIDMGHATPIKQETSIRTTLGDTFFAIISGGECTQDVTYPGRINLEEHENNGEPSEELEDTHLYLLGMEKSNIPKIEHLKNVDEVLDYNGSSDNEHAKSDLEVPDSEKAHSIYQKGAKNSKESKHTKSFTLIDKDKIVNLKTEVGSTGDAVVTEDEETRLVTFDINYQDKDFEPYELQTEEDIAKPTETPLLSYEEFNIRSSDQTSFKNDSTSITGLEAMASPSNEEVGFSVDMGHATPIKQDKSILTTLGDTFFAIVSGGEHTRDITDLDGTDSFEQEIGIETSEEVEKDKNLYLLGMEKSNKYENEQLELHFDEDTLVLGEEGLQEIEQNINITANNVSENTVNISSSDGTPRAKSSTDTDSVQVGLDVQNQPEFLNVKERSKSKAEAVDSEISENTKEERNVGEPAKKSLSDEKSDMSSSSHQTAFEDDSSASISSKSKESPSKEEIQVSVDMGHATTIKQENSIRTTLGDTFFAIVSGGECTQDVTDLDRNDSEQEDDEPSKEVEKSNNLYLLGMEKNRRENEHLEPPFEDNTVDLDDGLWKTLPAVDGDKDLTFEQKINIIANKSSTDSVQVEPDVSKPPENISVTQASDLKTEGVDSKISEKTTEESRTPTKTSGAKEVNVDHSDKPIPEDLQENKDIKLKDLGKPSLLEKSNLGSPNSNQDQTEVVKQDKRPSLTSEFPADIKSASDSLTADHPREVEDSQVQSSDQFVKETESPKEGDDEEKINVKHCNPADKQALEKLPVMDIDVLVHKDSTVHSFVDPSETNKKTEHEQLYSSYQEEKREPIDTKGADNFNVGSTDSTLSNQDLAEKAAVDAERPPGTIDKGEKGHKNVDGFLEDENTTSDKPAEEILAETEKDTKVDPKVSEESDLGQELNRSLESKDTSKQENQDSLQVNSGIVTETNVEKIGEVNVGPVVITDDPIKKKNNSDILDTKIEKETATLEVLSKAKITKQDKQEDISDKTNDKIARIGKNEPFAGELPDDSIPLMNNAVQEATYVENIKVLSIMREYLNEMRIAQFTKYLGPGNIMSLEAMFQDLDSKLKLAWRDSLHLDHIHKALDQILELSSSNILDFVESVLNTQEETHDEEMFGEKAGLIVDVQKISLRLRHKLSTQSDSSLLASGLVTEKKEEKPTSDEMNPEEEKSDPEPVANKEESTVTPEELPPKVESTVIQEEMPPEEDSTVNQPPEEDSTVSQPPVEDSTINQPPVEESTMNQPPVEESTMNQPPVEGSTVNQPPVEESTVNQPPVEESTVNQPPVEESTVNQPTVEESTVNQPTVEDSTMNRPPVEDATMNQPPVEDATMNQPPVEDSTMNQPPVEDLTVSQPPVEESTVTPEEVPPVEASTLNQLPVEESTVIPEEVPSVEESTVNQLPVETEVVLPTQDSLDHIPHKPDEAVSQNEEDVDIDAALEGDRLEEPQESESWLTSILQTFSSMGSALLSAKSSLGPVGSLLMSALPEDMQPGPDFLGVQWEAVIITLLVGMISIMILFWRTCLSVKSRVYQVSEKQLVEKIAALMKEKSEALEKISELEKKIKEAKESESTTQEKSTHLQEETASLKVSIKELKNGNKQLDTKMRNLLQELDSQKSQNKRKQEMIYEGQKSIEQLKQQYEQHSAELSEMQIALNETKLKEQKVRSDLRSVQEENTCLKARKEQLLKETEGWSERQRELEEQIQLQQKSHKDMEEALAYKENEIEVLTNCIMQLKQLEEDTVAGEDGSWQPDGDGELENGELPDKRKEKMKLQIKQMMDVSRVKTTLSIIEEEKDLYQRKLTDEVSARQDLEDQIKQLQHDGSSLQSEKTRLDNESKTLRQKVEILTELYQQKEMALQKKLTQEEYERQEKEQRLSVADEKAILAVEEVKIYKQRIQEMEEELQKTERSFKNQIASHEKKAHENWLVARTAERTLTEEKRECANLRQKLNEVNTRVTALQRPSIVKPAPGRPEHQPPPRRGALSRDGSFGPSPVSGGAPSPPMMMDVSLRSASANLNRSEGNFGGMDASSGTRRPSHDMSGRTSAPVDLGRSATVLNSGPRTSSPSVDGLPNPSIESEAPIMSASSLQQEESPAVMPVAKGPPSFPGTPVRNSPAGAPMMSQPPGRLIGPTPQRGHFGSRALPPGQMHGPPRSMMPPGGIHPSDPRGLIRGQLPPRDYPPGPVPLHAPRDYPMPPPGARDFPPGLPPPGPRDFPPGPPHPGPRDFPPGPPHPGPRDFPPGPPHPGSRDFPPGALPPRDFPPGPRDFFPGPPPPSARDFPPGLPPPGAHELPPGMRDFPPGPLPPGARDIPPGLPPPGARDFPPVLPPLGSREFVPGLPHPGARHFLPGPPLGPREFLPGPPPPGARDFPPGPPTRDFVAGPHPGVPAGPSLPDHRPVPQSHNLSSQTDPSQAHKKV